MAKVFISYSRKDIEFAKRLTGELQKSEMDFWIDWEGIPPTVDWWKEIEKGIEEADAFLFIISPDSARSKVCGQEIDTAVKNGKRIIPIVVREIEWHDTPAQLGHLNYIFFSRNDDFDAATKKLITAIHTDYEWTAAHRRLQVKALEWDRKNKENSLLLRGKDLQEAELLLKANAFKEPRPTELQNEYISESRKVEEKQLKSARLRRNVISVASVISLIIIFLAVTGRFNRLIYLPMDMEDYWITIPAGDFLMGSSDADIQYAKNLCSDCDFSNEQPQRTVYLDTYQIGKYEITNRQYTQCVKAGICGGKPSYPEDRALYPVVSVTWDDASTYCEWVGGRLPSEAEWEKAASWDNKTKTKYTYPWGNNQPNSGLLNYDQDIGDITPVGKYPSGASPYGLYDMAGNVWEWTNDWYDKNYYDTVYNDTHNPHGPDSGNQRVVRGGSWDDLSYYARSSYRSWFLPSSSNIYFGFRCVRSQQEQ